MKPAREPATRNGQTYFVTSLTSGRRPYFRYERWARLFLDTLFRYRNQGEYSVHEFVVMPDHVHLLITPSETLERAVQLLKGGFSREASLRFEPRHDIWQRGFSDHRVRDLVDYDRHARYIRLNPVKAALCDRSEEYPFSSVLSEYELDPVPQGLKPLDSIAQGGTAKAVPFKEPVLDRIFE